MRVPVSGVRVGHWTDTVGLTGATVVELPRGTTASYECRGGAPASRELTVLEPDKTVTQVDAVLLTGGSAFGLAAADGVMRRYEELDRGVPTSAGRVPIVPALALFDLAVGDPRARPTAQDGYAAACAVADDAELSGRVGAGTGAYVGQWRGPTGRSPGGLGHGVSRFGDVVVWALVAVNAFGDVDHGTSVTSLAAAVQLQRQFVARGEAGERLHTTIGVVVTNARLDKVGCHVVAQGAHDGLARAVTPPHTRYDGDAFVAAATGQVEADLDVVRLLAVAAVCDAVRSAGAPG
ncbi:MAG: P1 family peptidase [Actinomycetota bacterium]|nr:P1 family peptidase [Actinomycetota bacterium]